MQSESRRRRCFKTDELSGDGVRGDVFADAVAAIIEVKVWD
jgi:hypothetical protein